MNNEPNNTPQKDSGLFTTVQNRSRLLKIMRDAPEVYQRIMMFIEQGAYDYIAAECFGITKQTWDKWMARGRKAQEGYYRKFFLDVTQASSRARLVAEISVFKDDPKFYLMNGPGKTKPDRPGWSRDPIDKDLEVSQREDTHKKAATHEDADVNDLAASLKVMEDLGLVTFVNPAITNEHPEGVEEDDVIEGKILNQIPSE